MYLHHNRKIFRSTGQQQHIEYGGRIYEESYQTNVHRFIVLLNKNRVTYDDRIEEISKEVETFILLVMANEALEPKKKLLVIHLTNYPYITAYFDYREQKNLAYNNVFMNEVVEAWSVQPFGNIVTVIINSKCGSMRLKRLKL